MILKKLHPSCKIIIRIREEKEEEEEEERLLYTVNFKYKKKCTRIRVPSILIFIPTHDNSYSQKFKKYYVYNMHTWHTIRVYYFWEK